MASDFDELMSELPGGENRLAELFRQVTASLAALAERTRRLGDLFQAVAPPGGLGPSPRGMQAAAPNPPLSRGHDRVAADNARANQQTAKAVEELLRNGIRLREVPPATYGE